MYASGLVYILKVLFKVFQPFVEQILRGPAPHRVSLWIQRIKVHSQFIGGGGGVNEFSFIRIIFKQASYKSGALQYFQRALEVGCEPLDAWDRIHNFCSGEGYHLILHFFLLQSTFTLRFLCETRLELVM